MFRKYGLAAFVLIAGLSMGTSNAQTVIDTTNKTLVQGTPLIDGQLEKISGSFQSNSGVKLGTLTFSQTYTGLSKMGSVADINSVSCKVDLYSDKNITATGSCTQDTGFCSSLLTYQVSGVVTLSGSGTSASVDLSVTSPTTTCTGKGWTAKVSNGGTDSYSFDLVSGNPQLVVSTCSLKINGSCAPSPKVDAIFAPTVTTSYPIILVHGLNSDDTTWSKWGGWLNSYGGTLSAIDKLHIFSTGDNSNLSTKGDPQSNCQPTTSDFFETRFWYACDPKGQYFTQNFADSKNTSFFAQALQLKEIVNAVTKLTGKDKVVLVGHSMGGLAARAYVQFFNDNKVYGIITIGTPHLGAYPITNMGNIGNWLTGSVAAQLQYGSNDLKLLNDFTNHPFPADVKGYAIGVVNPASQLIGDDVVAFESQVGTITIHDSTTGKVTMINKILPWPSNYSTDYIYDVQVYAATAAHLNETASQDVFKKVMNVLTSWDLSYSTK